MNPQEAKAYNEKHNLTGKPNELLIVVGPRGRQELMTRKNLAAVKGFRVFDPAKPPTPIDKADLSDDVMAIEKERQRLVKENAELKAQLSKAEKYDPYAPSGQSEPKEAAPKKRGRPKKNPVDA